MVVYNTAHTGWSVSKSSTAPGLSTDQWPASDGTPCDTNQSSSATRETLLFRTISKVQCPVIVSIIEAVITAFFTAVIKAAIAPIIEDVIRAVAEAVISAAIGWINVVRIEGAIWLDFQISSPRASWWSQSLLLEVFIVKQYFLEFIESQHVSNLSYQFVFKCQYLLVQGHILWILLLHCCIYVGVRPPRQLWQSSKSLRLWAFGYGRVIQLSWFGWYSEFTFGSLHKK